MEQNAENNSKYFIYSPNPGYTYAIETKEGIKVDTIDLPADNVNIKMGNYSPKLKIKSKEIKYKSWKWLFFLDVPSDEQYEFYIPEE